MDAVRKHARRVRALEAEEQTQRATRADSLEYLSDMIAQLRALAEGAGCPNLAVLLGRAQAEARVQRERG
jgi:hypothetical protein